MSTKKRYLFCVWLAVVSCLGAGAVLRGQDGEVDDDSIVIPQRPAGQILDAARWFSLDEKEHAQKELDRLHRENQIDVYIVTRSEQPSQDAKSYVRKLGEAWSRSPVWGVVFHVPGDPAGFHIEAGGVEIDRKRIDRVVAEASSRARKEATEKDRVMAAWRECSEGLRFLHVAGQRQNDQVVEKKKNLRSDWISRQKWKKILIVCGVGGFVPLAIAACFLIGVIRRRRLAAVFEFPETSWRTRYQAPHSGGGGIGVGYRVPKSEG